MTDDHPNKFINEDTESNEENRPSQSSSFFSCFSIEFISNLFRFYQPYFEVNNDDMKVRVIKSLIPPYKSDFYEETYHNPDL